MTKYAAMVGLFMLTAVLPVRAQEVDCETAYLETLTTWQLYYASGGAGTPERADPVDPCYRERLHAQADAFTQSQPVTEPTAVPVIEIPTPVPPPFVSDAEQMRQALQVQVTGTRLQLRNTSARQFSDRLFILFTATNTGTADIRAFTGMVIFRDLFDRELKQVRLTYDTATLPAGQARAVDTMYFELNQFIDNDQRIRNSDPSSIQVSFQVASILFTDGRRIGEPR